METKDYPTGVLIKRLLSVMKHLLPYIGVAVLFAVLGFVVTVAIPSYLVWLAFSALAGQTLSLWHLLALVVLALAHICKIAPFGACQARRSGQRSLTQDDW